MSDIILLKKASIVQVLVFPLIMDGWDTCIVKKAKPWIINAFELWWSFNNMLCWVQSLSHVQLFVTPWTAARQASLSITNSWSLRKPVPVKSVMPSNHLILCHPLLLLPSIFPSIRFFSHESVLQFRWPKYGNFSMSTSDEHSGLISFRINWFALLVVQGTLERLLQHYSSKASTCQCSDFFIVWISHPYVTNKKQTKKKT